MALSPDQFPGERINTKITRYLTASIFYKVLNKKMFTPDIYQSSILLRHFINPVSYIRIKSDLFKNISKYVLFLSIFIFALYNPVISCTAFAKFRLGLLLLAILPLGIILSRKRDRVPLASQGWLRLPLKGWLRLPVKTAYDLPVFLLITVAALSLRTVQTPPAFFSALRELSSLLIFIISIYIVIYIFEKKEIRKLLRILCAGALGASLFYIFAAVFLKNSGIYLKNTFGNPNHFGYFLVLVYPVLFVMALDNSEKLKYLWRVGLVFILVPMFLNRSLGTGIAFFTSLFILTVNLKRRWLSVFTALAIMGIVLCSYTRHILSEEISLDYGSTIMARIEVWKQALSDIYTRPILGTGLGQFHASAKPHYAKEMYNAFSVFFHLAATTGLLGAGVFLWFLMRVFRLNLYLIANERLYGAGLLASLTAAVIGFFWDNHLFAVMTNWLIGILLGSIFVLAQDTEGGRCEKVIC